MPGKTQAQKEKNIKAKRCERACSWLADFRNDLAVRLLETRKLFKDPVVIIDPHTHSEYSDGSATIAMNRDAGIAAGIDVVFATDHRSRGQKRAVNSMKTMSWGQEPGSAHHHIGLLCNTRLFKPRGDRLDLDFERARKLAPFVWIPHPAGWYPGREYTKEQLDSLWTLGPDFAMEVINGAHKIGSAFDRFDEKAVAVWDKLLSDGIRVPPLGGSDAHVPESIGCCWTAVTGAGADTKSVIAGLNAGRCIASESCLLALRINSAPMGSTASFRRGRGMSLHYRVSDSAGLQCIRIIAGGRVRKTLYPRGASHVEGTWSFKPSNERYARLEARAVDNRRAFSSPVYLKRLPGRS